MKKFLALFLGVVLLLSMVSCSSPKNDTDSRYVYPSKKTVYQDESDTAQETESDSASQYYTLSFQTNGGSKVGQKQLEEGSILNVSPITSRNGYLFEGWFFDQALTSAVTFPLAVNWNMTLYAKWLCLEKIVDVGNTTVKNWDDNKSKSFVVTPEGFDMDRLSSLGYKMTITVTYNVSYRQDYDVLFDIGYLGAPKYDVSLQSSNGYGTAYTDLSTTTYEKTKTIRFSTLASNLKDKPVILGFSSDNIQNTVYIDDITISYLCSK